MDPETRAKLKRDLDALDAERGYSLHYKLDPDNNVIPCSTYEWAIMFEDFELRKVAQDQLSDDVRVSTVFIGLDRNFSGEGPPLVFETMVFGDKLPKLDQDAWLAATWEEALKNHEFAKMYVQHLLEDDRG